MKLLPIHSLCVFALKYIPVLICLMQCIHCATLLMGYQLNIAELIGSQSLFTFVMFMISSYAFRFCRLHRLLIIYNYAVSLCVDFHRLFSFGYCLTPMRIIMLLAGIILIIQVAHRKITQQP